MGLNDSHRMKLQIHLESYDIFDRKLLILKLKKKLFVFYVAYRLNR